MFKRIIPWTLLPTLALALFACDQSEPAPAPSAATVPGELFLTEAPAGAVNVAAARQSADGQEVVVRGIVGGQKDPFVASRAVMTIVDRNIKSCNQLPGDTCATPWDYCCEPREELRANVATVQVAAPDGKPLAAGLKGAGGLKPLSDVIVKGKLSKSADGNVIINATALHVVQ